MRKHAIVAVFVALALAACGDDTPPTQIVIVISPTPETVTSETAEPDAVPSNTPAVSPTDLPAPTTEAASTQPRASVTPRPTATTPPAAYPTSTVAEVGIAEQVYEHGRMFWIRHTREIWVMQASEDDPNSGDWFCFNDTFEEGEMEIDPDLIPPEGLFQPRRGFGKLWRNNDTVHDGLGWATTPEFELTSNYTYIPGGYVENGKYAPGPGEHRLTTLYNESISFFEGTIRGECKGGTWRMSPAQ